MSSLGFVTGIAPRDRTLVVIFLRGGADGLTLVAPVADDAYHRARPKIGIRESAFKLDDHFALNPGLGILKNVYDQGHLAIVNGCGYPKPNRSHFRSMEIWQTANVKEPQPQGWLGHYLDHVARGTAVAAGAAPAAGTAKAAAAERSEEDRVMAATLPQGVDVSVVVLPAHDPADEIAGTMVANALQVRGYRVTVMSVTALASEMVEMVEREKADVVVVSALPPAAVTHSRYLCKRLHAKYPDIETVVGLWTWKGDMEKAKDRVACARSVRMAGSLCEAMEAIHQAVQPILMKRTEQKAK